MLRKYLVGFLLLALFGLVILPALAFAVGQFVIGPYEGENGLFGYMDAIYRGLAAGSPAAILLVTSPLIVVLSWWLVRRVMQMPALADRGPKE